MICQTCGKPCETYGSALYAQCSDCACKRLTAEAAQNKETKNEFVNSN